MNCSGVWNIGKEKNSTWLVTTAKTAMHKINGKIKKAAPLLALLCLNPANKKFRATGWFLTKRKLHKNNP
jgi:hypothetical protein